MVTLTFFGSVEGKSLNLVIMGGMAVLFVALVVEQLKRISEEKPVDSPFVILYQKFTSDSLHPRDISQKNS